MTGRNVPIRIFAAAAAALVMAGSSLSWKFPASSDEPSTTQPLSPPNIPDSSQEMNVAGIIDGVYLGMTNGLTSYTSLITMLAGLPPEVRSYVYDQTFGSLPIYEQWEIIGHLDHPRRIEADLIDLGLMREAGIFNALRRSWELRPVPGRASIPGQIGGYQRELRAEFGD